MLSESDFNMFCISKGLQHETLSIKAVEDNIQVTITVKGKAFAKNFTAVADTTSNALSTARQMAVDHIDRTVAISTDAIEYLEKETKRLGISYSITYSPNGERFGGSIDLTHGISIISIPFESSSHADIHHLAAEKAKGYLSTLS